MTVNLAFLRHALALARRNQGLTGANPSVGCVLVKENQVISAAVTERSGRPHAENIAVKQSVAGVEGATAYITLEPCVAFPGKMSESCASILISKGIKRVVVGARDPHEQISGRGVEALRAAGIEVVEAHLPEIKTFYEAERIRHARKRPYVTAKLATSLDGRIALGNQQSKWITGPESRELGHKLRSVNHAIMTGIGTIQSDDPELTCRINGLEGTSPLRIVLDSHFSISEEARIVQTEAKAPVWIFSTEDALKANQDKKSSLQKKNIRVLSLAADSSGRLEIQSVLKKLTEEGVSTVLLESGPRLFTSALKADVIDQLYWFQAPLLLGADSIPVAKELCISSLSEERGWKIVEHRSVGPDSLSVLKANDRLEQKASL